jgi:hypothetical protein
MGKQNKANQKLRIPQIDLERIIGLKTKKNRRKKERGTNKQKPWTIQTDRQTEIFYFIKYFHFMLINIAEKSITLQALKVWGTFIFNS